MGERASDEPKAMHAVVSILLSLAAIIACGGAGALIAFALVGAMGLTGVPSAIVAAITGIVVATLLWALGVALLRLLRVLK